LTDWYVLLIINTIINQYLTEIRAAECSSCDTFERGAAMSAACAACGHWPSAEVNRRALLENPKTAVMTSLTH